MREQLTEKDFHDIDKEIKNFLKRGNKRIDSNKLPPSAGGGPEGPAGNVAPEDGENVRRLPLADRKVRKK